MGHTSSVKASSHCNMISQAFMSELQFSHMIIYQGLLQGFSPTLVTVVWISFCRGQRAHSPWEASFQELLDKGGDTLTRGDFGWPDHHNCHEISWFHELAFQELLDRGGNRTGGKFPFNTNHKLCQNLHWPLWLRLLSKTCGQSNGVDC